MSIGQEWHTSVDGVWRRYSESVTVLRSPRAADALAWEPPRPRFTTTG